MEETGGGRERGIKKFQSIGNVGYLFEFQEIAGIASLVYWPPLQKGTNTLRQINFAMTKKKVATSAQNGC